MIPRPRFLVPALLATALLALYGPVTAYDFISIDDSQYVAENSNVTGGLSWAGVLWAFKTPVAGNWHPLTMLSHMLDCEIYGLWPGGHHLTNVLLHIANTLLLFWVLLRMTEKKPQRTETRVAGKSPSAAAPPPSPLWPCALVAALFALHPLHVESIAWVSERKDVLSAFFFMLTLLAYDQYVGQAEKLERRAGFPAARQAGGHASSSPREEMAWERHRLPSRFTWAASWYALSLLFFTLGLMSKPMLVTFPCVLLLLDYWPLQRFGTGIQNSKSKYLRPLFLEKLPFFVLAAIFGAITFFLQKRAGAVVGMEDFPLKARLANAMASYAWYLGKTFWPCSLAMPYPYQGWEQAEIGAAAVLFAALTLAAIWAARRRPHLFVGWFWFAAMLAPVSGLLQAGFQGMADRYTYLPAIGVFVALAWGLAAVRTASAGRRVLACSGAILVAALMAATWAQLRHWKNSQTLFEHAVRVAPDNSAAHYLLGAVFESQDKPELAQWHFTEAIRLHPDNVRARCGLGYLFCMRGEFEEAARQYETALSSQPDLAKAHFGLAEVLRQQGRPDQAIAHYLSALRAKADIPEAHYQLAGLFSGRQDPATAIPHLQQAVRLAPDWVLPLNNLAWALATQPQTQLRDGAEAMHLALKAVHLTRRVNPGTLDTLAAAYAEAGRFPDAVATAQDAIQKATTSGQTNLAAEIASRLKLYQAQKPYRE